MTIINQNSISGITSITAASGSVQIFNSDGSSGSLTDLAGINVAGVVTATSFVGDGSSLTGIDATQIVTGNTSVQTVDTGSDGHIKFNTEGSEVARFDSSGNFGLGTASPSNILSVADAGGPTVRFTDSTSGAFSLLQIGSNGDFTISADHGDSGASTNIIFKSDGAIERARIDSSGRLSLGTSAPGNYDPAADNLVVYSTGETGITIASGTSSGGNIYFADGTTGNELYRGWITYSHNVDAMRFGTSGTERLRILSGGGLTFNGDTATANALDDYEEGTWTPTFSAPGATFTYSSQQGSYIKIGTLVYAAFFVQISAISGGTGTCGVGGLPFATGNSASNPNPGGFIQLVNNWNTNHPDSLEANGSLTTVFNLNYRTAANGTNNQGVPTSNFQANTFVRATAVYFSS